MPGDYPFVGPQVWMQAVPDSADRRTDERRSPTRTVKKPSPEEIEEAILYIRHSTFNHLEYWQAFMDGVTLAGEQVQDKRLQILEIGPEVTGLDIFLDFCFTLILETPLAGKALQLMTKLTIGRRVRLHLIAKQKVLRGVQKGERVLLRSPDSLVSIPKEIAVRQLNEELQNLRRRAKSLSEAVPDYLVGFAQAVKQVAPQNVRTAASDLPSDTPGVSILEQAQEHASRHRLLLQTEQALFEYFVRTGQMTIDEVIKEVRWDPIVVDGKAVSLAEVRDRNKRFFELVIWALLLLERPLTGADTGVPRRWFTLQKEYVPPSLSRYWVKRFTDPETGRPFSETPALRDPRGGPDYDQAVPTLGNYMWKVAQQAMQRKIRLFADGSLIPNKELPK